MTSMSALEGRDYDRAMLRGAIRALRAGDVATADAVLSTFPIFCYWAPLILLRIVVDKRLPSAGTVT